MTYAVAAVVYRTRKGIIESSDFMFLCTADEALHSLKDVAKAWHFTARAATVYAEDASGNGTYLQRGTDRQLHNWWTWWIQ